MNSLLNEDEQTEYSRLEDEVVTAARAWFGGAVSEANLRMAIIALEKYENELYLLVKHRGAEIRANHP